MWTAQYEAALVYYRLFDADNLAMRAIDHCMFQAMNHTFGKELMPAKLLAKQCDRVIRLDTEGNKVEALDRIVPLHLSVNRRHVLNAVL